MKKVYKPYIGLVVMALDNYMKYYKLMGDNIAYYRKKKHLTQHGLAMRANISRTHISHIEAENVDKAPSLDILFRICDILGVEPYQLFVAHEKETGH